MRLYSHQIQAVEEMHNGCILCGDVGTGKSRTALLYFFTKVCGGNIPINGKGVWGNPTTPRALYIITTAKKRDSYEWEDECIPFALSTNQENSVCGIKVNVDSWNKIKSYTNVSGAFFIFDEQRVSGWGRWAKSFLRIASRNQWILLSATPGDKWSDYISVFVANGFYRTKYEFEKTHCVYNPYLNFPKIDRYENEALLNKHRRDILVRMEFEKPTQPTHHRIICSYDKREYKRLMRDRWNTFTNEPVENISQLCYLLRKVVNSDNDRLVACKHIVDTHNGVIIFYNYDYELELIKETCSGYTIAEWNGHKHEPVPKGDKWVYLVQYNAGAEGWNCITTDTMVFYSQSYSYRMTKQAEGRIDRMNTTFKTLYYYHLSSTSPIDLAIGRALAQKKDFNENALFSARKTQKKQ